MNELGLYYSTFANKEQALKMAKTLIEHRLIACANVIAGVESVYSWQGEVQQEQEIILLLKTEAAKEEKIKQFFITHHPYEVFCLIRLERDFINPEYNQWLRDCLS